jgi:hypothetical protein
MMRSIKSLGTLVLALSLNAAATVRADEVKGTVKSVDGDKNEVVLKGVVRNTIYEFNKDAHVHLDGMKAKLTDLKEGDRAVITYEKKGEHMMASHVRALRKAQEVSGTVRETLAEKHGVVLKGLIKDTTYELQTNGTVWINDTKGVFSDIRKDDQATITYEQNGDQLVAIDFRVTRK